MKGQSKALPLDGGGWGGGDARLKHRSTPHASPIHFTPMASPETKISMSQLVQRGSFPGSDVHYFDGYTLAPPPSPSPPPSRGRVRLGSVPSYLPRKIVTVIERHHTRCRTAQR